MFQVYEDEMNNMDRTTKHFILCLILSSYTKYKRQCVAIDIPCCKMCPCNIFYIVGNSDKKKLWHAYRYVTPYSVHLWTIITSTIKGWAQGWMSLQLLDIVFLYTSTVICGFLGSQLTPLTWPTSVLAVP